MKRFALHLFLALSPAWLAAQPLPPAPPRMGAMPDAYSREGYLGLGLQEVTAERAKALKLKEEAGVEITRIATDSPAEKGGLKTGDVVLQYNGTRVEGFEQFSRMVRETPVGREAKLLVFRNGAEQTITVKIGPRPAAFPFPMPDVRTPDVPSILQGMHSPMLGVDVEPISGQFADFFGVKEGVVVREVMKNSPAEKAGLKAGDVIIRMEEMKINSAHDITAKLRAAAGKSIPVAVMRDHKETTLTVDVPERRFGRALPARYAADEN